MVKLLEKYLEPSFYCESDSPEIRSLAKRVTKGKKGEAAAKKIFTLVRDIPYGVADVVGAKGVLKRKPSRAICVDKANLMVALSRASGIPARYIALNVKLKMKKDVPVLAHMVSEVYYGNKWHMMDPSFGKSCAKIIPMSRFDKVTNWKAAGKPVVYGSLLPFIPFVTWFMYRTNPTFVMLKKIFGGG